MEAFERHEKLFRLVERPGRKGYTLSYLSDVLKDWRRTDHVSGMSEAKRLIDAQYETGCGAFARPSIYDQPESVLRKAKRT